MAKPKYERWLTPEGLVLIEGWARDGLTNKQIAHNIGITEQTLDVWRKAHPSFSDSLKKGKEVADYEVENALFKSATGFTAENGQYYPPSYTAGIFWLKNRRPDKWRDKPAEPKTDNGILHDLMELVRHD